MTLSPKRLSALLRWLDATEQQAEMPRSAVAAARDAVLSQDPRAYARCEQVRTLVYLSGCDIPVREALGYFDAEDDGYAEMKAALLDLWQYACDDGQGYDDPAFLAWQDRAEQQWDAYLHALNAAGMDREALDRCLDRARFATAAARLHRRRIGRPVRVRRCSTPSTTALLRRRVVSTPMSSNAPPARESRMYALDTAPP